MQSTVIFHTNKTIMDKLEQHCGELPGDQSSWLVATLRLSCVNSGRVPVARARTVGHQEIRKLVLENVGVRSSVRTLADLGGPRRTLAGLGLGGPWRTSADTAAPCHSDIIRKCLPTWSYNPPRMVWKSIREWLRDLSLSVTVSLCLHKSIQRSMAAASRKRSVKTHCHKSHCVAVSGLCLAKKKKHVKKTVRERSLLHESLCAGDTQMEPNWSVGAIWNSKVPPTSC